MDATPRQCEQVVKYGKSLIRKLDRIEPISPSEIRRFVKRSMANAYHSRLTEFENEKAHKYQRDKLKRKSAGQKVAQKGGIITINDVRFKIQGKELDAVAKAEAQIRQAEKTREKAIAQAHKEAVLVQKPFWALHYKHVQLAEEFEIIRLKQWCKLMKRKVPKLKKPRGGRKRGMAGRH